MTSQGDTWHPLATQGWSGVIKGHMDSNQSGLVVYTLFFFGCSGSSLLPTAFLWLRRSKATLCCNTWASHCRSFSCCWAQPLGRAGFSGCGAWTWLFHGMWDLPRSGIELISLAPVGGFLSTVPSEKSVFIYIYILLLQHDDNDLLPQSL